MKDRRIHGNERARLRGEVTIEIRRPGAEGVETSGALVRRIVVRNTITYTGLNALLTLLAQASITPVDYAARRLVPGTNGTPPTPGDLALGAPVGSSDQVVLSGVNFSHNTSSRELIISGTLTTGQANGLVLREIGLQLQNGSLFARQVHPFFEKDGSMSVTYTWRISVTA